MPATGPTGTASIILLPERLHLPDLTRPAPFTRTDLSRWRTAAVTALTWGPARRNGCIRTPNEDGDPIWVDEHGHPRSPDRYTPSIAGPAVVAWHRTHNPDDQPDRLTRVGPTWSDPPGAARLHAPVMIHFEFGPVWEYGNVGIGDALADLLTAAWEDTDLPDTEAVRLLHTAQDAPAAPDLPVTPTAWVAHVLAANPSPHLTRHTRLLLALHTT